MLADADILGVMNRSTMTRGLLAAAVILLASTASAQPTTNAPTKGSDKGSEKAEKGSDKAGERAARKAKEHEAQKTELTALLKAPADDALKEELRRHAERLARIERIKSVATEAKDTDTTARATK